MPSFHWYSTWNSVLTGVFWTKIWFLKLHFKVKIQSSVHCHTKTYSIYTVKKATGHYRLSFPLKPIPESQSITTYLWWALQYVIRLSRVLSYQIFLKSTENTFIKLFQLYFIKNTYTCPPTNKKWFNKYSVLKVTSTHESYAWNTLELHISNLNLGLMSLNDLHKLK